MRSIINGVAIVPCVLIAALIGAVVGIFIMSYALAYQTAFNIYKNKENFYFWEVIL